ncbi:hypothetical protein Ddye_020253 [Dipteronia dyeriana]|uniref:Uncharacterized protein n=1 Tax=Dipteronia dyeriana TaxID=168575 RepID=A0AAD9TZU5_9ROSI|nr:hypothetical protein Ddye_020253 [Dipteronia dyeriana]
MSRKRDRDFYVPNYEGEWKKKQSGAVENVVNGKDEVGVEISAPHVDSTLMESSMENEILGDAEEVGGISSMQNEIDRLLRKPDSGLETEFMDLAQTVGLLVRFAVDLFGDVNEIMSDVQKRGEKQKKKEGYRAAFREATEDCLLEDLGFVGDKYTWCNKSKECDDYGAIGYVSRYQGLEIPVF